MAELKHPIREAERYLENARQILSEKAEKDGGYYSDRKYVRMAGNTAWNGVLIALDAVLPIRANLKKGQHPDIRDYQEAVSKKDSKMNGTLHNAYELLHKSIGYDGVTHYKVVQESLKQANMMIAWADKQYENQKKN